MTFDLFLCQRNKKNDEKCHWNHVNFYIETKILFFSLNIIFLKQFKNDKTDIINDEILFAKKINDFLWEILFCMRQIFFFYWEEFYVKTLSKKRKKKKNETNERNLFFSRCGLTLPYADFFQIFWIYDGSFLRF